MGGIFGILLVDPYKIPGSVLEAASDALRNRGPDALGSFRAPGVLLGMRRLSIVDPDGPDPPYRNESGRIQVVGDGEIYNHTSIRNRLAANGHEFGTANDLEVLAHLAERPSIDWELGLRGMFAFGIWDRHECRLHLARDRFGIKPLFWCGDEENLAFASTLPALKAMLLAWGREKPDTLARAGIGRFTRSGGWRINKPSLRWYLDAATIPAPDTIYEEVFCLPPAGRLTWMPGKAVSVERYWQPSCIPKRVLSMRSALGEFRRCFRESVRHHLVSDVPVGALLSGGLDSGYLVAEAASQLGRRLSTYTVGFRESNRSELGMAREVAAACGADHHEILLEPLRPEDLTGIVGAMNQPLGEPSVWPTWAIAKSVGAERKAALAGDGGDELWGGAPYYSLANLGRLLPKRGRRIDKDPFGTSLISRGRRVLDDLFQSPDQVWRRWHHLDPMGGFWNRLLRPEWRAEPVDLLPCSRGTTMGTLSEHERLLEMDVRRSLPFGLLEKVDTVSMAHSLEVRTPWLDPVLFELVAHFPPRFKVNGGVTKWLVHQSLIESKNGHLLTSLLHTRSRGHAVPVQHWLRSNLADFFEETALAKGSTNRVLFDGKQLRKEFENHRAGFVRLGRQLWSVLVLEIWLRESGVSV